MKCEVSETDFEAEPVAADKRARSLFYRSVRGDDSSECKHTSVFSVWFHRRAVLMSVYGHVVLSEYMKIRFKPPYSNPLAILVI